MMRQLRWSFLWLASAGLSLSVQAAGLTTARSTKEPEIDGTIARQLAAAIWGDLQMNALFGNGAGLAGRLFEAAETEYAELHIRSLRCRPSEQGQNCSFDLFKDGGTKSVETGAAPQALHCTASFYRSEEGWKVDHVAPPRRGMHSQTTLQCSQI